MTPVAQPGPPPDGRVLGEDADGPRQTSPTQAVGASLLVALFDRVVDGLLAEAAVIAGEARNPAEKLDMLVAGHIEAALRHRELFEIYLREAQNLAEADRRRLRHKQRRYVDEWVGAVAVLKPGLSDPELRTIIQAAIGAIQSLLRYDGGLSRHRLRAILTSAARAALQAPLADQEPEGDGP